MDQKRTIVFFILSFLILLGYPWLMRMVMPPKPPAAPVAQQPAAPKEGAAAPAPAGDKLAKPDAKPDGKLAKVDDKPELAVEELAEKQPREWTTLGSADP